MNTISFAHDQTLRGETQCTHEYPVLNIAGQTSKSLNDFLEQSTFLCVLSLCVSVLKVDVSKAAN